MDRTRGEWAGRFVWVAILHGAIAVVITVLIVQPQSKFHFFGYFTPSKIIVGGGPGTWLFTGYILYLVVGVIGAGVTALFYMYLEGFLGRRYQGRAEYLALGHLILMNVGVAGASLLMIYAGYLGGWAGAPTSEGGLGLDDAQIHAQYLARFVQPIGAFVLLACLGAILGGLGYILTERSRGAGDSS